MRKLNIIVAPGPACLLLQQKTEDMSSATETVDMSSVVTEIVDISALALTGTLTLTLTLSLA